MFPDFINSAEMAIKILVMCQLTETWSVWWNLQVQLGIFVQILGDTSISEHPREWKRTEICIEQKEIWRFEYLAVIPGSRSYMTVESKIYYPRENSCYNWSELISNNGEIGSRIRPYQPEALGPSDPGPGFGTKKKEKIFLFFPFFPQRPSPRRGLVTLLEVLCFEITNN